MVEQKLDGIQETLLIPLWARAVETGRTDAIIRDEHAVHMMKQIQYDFNKFKKDWKSQVGVAIRTQLLDQAVTAFITKYPNAVIINLGCGLDTRFFRVDNGNITWYDLDLPEPIRIRRQFFSETDRFHMIDKSIFDASWIKEVQIAQKPLLFIAEGIFMYFTEQEVKEIFTKLTDAFPKAEVLVEILSPLLVRNSRRHPSVGKMNAVFQWGVADGRSVEKLNQHVEFIEQWNYFDYHKKRWGWLRWMMLIPAFKRVCNNKIVHLKFK